MTTVLRSNKLP